MVCLYCGGSTAVTNSRFQKRDNSVWRRRRCQKCGALFTTREKAELARSWSFVDQDDHLHPFNPEKLMISLYDSLRHRSSAVSDATSLTQTVINKLARSMAARDGRLTRRQVVKTSREVLKRFDGAAATTYGAYHRP